MSKQVDRLFREKLSDHRLAPSEDAWTRVEASLGKEKKSVIWFRAAAAIVLLGVLTIGVILLRSDEDHVLATAKVDSTRVSTKSKITPAPKKAKRIDEPRLPVVKAPSHKMKVHIAQHEAKKETNLPAPIEQQVAIIQPVLEPIVQQEKAVIKSAKSSITLTYTLAPISSKEDRSIALEEKKGIAKSSRQGFGG